MAEDEQVTLDAARYRWLCAQLESFEVALNIRGISVDSKAAADRRIDGYISGDGYGWKEARPTNAG